MQKIRFGSTMHYIFDDSLESSSWSSYLMLKNVLRLKEAAVNNPRIKQLFFNQDFLFDEKARCGSLDCAFCPKTDLVIYQLFTNEKANKVNMATADHFWPKGKGGPAFDTDNLVVACYDCNNKKADKIYSIDTLIREEDRKKVSKFSTFL